jgi:plastocyanin
MGEWPRSDHARWLSRGALAGRLLAAPLAVEAQPASKTLNIGVTPGDLAGDWGMDIRPKGKVQLDVAFPTSGVLTFSCKFHGPLGMAGMLKVGD